MPTDTFDLAALASVEVTSEQELYPIDNVFDGRCGSGGSCWVAAKPGMQKIVLRFHAPVDILSVTVESEEQGMTCEQRLEIAGWSDHRQAPFEAAPRVLRYSPYGPSYYRETWDIVELGVTHVWFRVTPSPLVRLASLTEITIR